MLLIFRFFGSYLQFLHPPSAPRPPLNFCLPSAVNSNTLSTHSLSLHCSPFYPSHSSYSFSQPVFVSAPLISCFLPFDRLFYVKPTWSFTSFYYSCNSSCYFKHLISKTLSPPLSLLPILVLLLLLLTSHFISNSHISRILHCYRLFYFQPTFSPHPPSLLLLSSFTSAVTSNSLFSISCPSITLPTPHSTLSPSTHIRFYLNSSPLPLSPFLSPVLFHTPHSCSSTMSFFLLLFRTSHLTFLSCSRFRSYVHFCSDQENNISGKVRNMFFAIIFLKAVNRVR